jgi:glycerophosphoryl diester phosphodiesterase
MVAGCLSLDSIVGYAKNTVTFNSKSVELLIGKTTTVKAKTGNDKITYASTNKKIAKVNATTGKIKGISSGSCKIKATSSKGAYAYMKVTVKTPVTLDKSKVVLLVGESTTIKATAGKDKVTLSSSNEKIAKISSDGKVTGVSTGICKAVAMSSNGVRKAIWVYVQSSLNTTNINFIAHRGAMDIAPESTMAAFKEASKLGYLSTEFDIWQTNYNSFIVFHEKLSEKLGKNLTLKKLTANDVKKYPIVYGKNLKNYATQYIPSLAKVLKYVKSTKMDAYLHLKIGSSTLSFDENSAKLLANTIKKYGMESRATVFSSNKKALKLLESQKVKLGYLAQATTQKDMLTAVNYAKSRGYQVVLLRYYSDLKLPKDIVSTAHKAGLKIGCFSLTKTTQVEDLIDVGADFAVCNKVLFK